MELVLLGTGTCAPDPARTPACYFLTAGASRFLIDPGPGAIIRLLKAGIDPYDVDAILLTHHHLDHCSDLMPYLFNIKNCLGDRPKSDVKIFAPAGFDAVFEKLMDVFGQWITSPDYDIDIEEMSDGEYETSSVIIKSKPMLHGANAIGYRVTAKSGGKTVAYSGDTGYCAELVELAKNADALLVECSLPDGWNADGHMRPSDVALAGINSGVKKLILTHFYPMTGAEESAAIIRSSGYGGEVIAGEDGMKIEI